MIGAIIGLAVAFAGASWILATVYVPGGALAGAAIAFGTKPRGGRV
jgi:hypothetical protein